MGRKVRVIRQIGMLDVLPGSHWGEISAQKEVVQLAAKKQAKKGSEPTKVDTGHKKFKCAVCGKGFTTEAGLSDHTKHLHSSMSSNNNKKKKRKKRKKAPTINIRKGWTFNCPACEKQFITPAGLKKHLRTVHYQ